MNDQRPERSTYEQLKKLRTALAIYQGIKFQGMLQREREMTVSQDQAKRVTYLTQLFSRIHRQMFHDWHEQATAKHRPGTMLDAKKRKIFRETIARLVLDGEENKATAIFDNNGFVIRTGNISARLADFYQKMRKVRPLAYGNRITLDFFMIALGKLPSFKAVYEQGIDFRRLTQEDAIALHDVESSLDAITLAFKHAQDPGRNQSLQNDANSYGIWPENKIFVSGIPFLAHTTATGIVCLVTVNGGLMPLEGIKEELFIAGKNFADYPLSASENTIGYLPGTEALRAPGKDEIDGIRIGENGAAPLFCLDVNVLTGLRSPSHTDVVELIKLCIGEQAQIFDLADNAELKNTLLQTVAGDKKLQRSVEIAYARLHKVIKRLDSAKQNIFAGKTPDANPRFFMSMGGAGSGKTAVEEIATAHCGDNYVIASLDEFRKQSDLYNVLTAANHHSDDYVYVEPFATRLRTVVAEHARLNKFNILYDGTSVPYQTRYANIVRQFNASGFATQIIAVDAFIIKPEGREDELPRSAVIGSVKNRFKQTGRALPWVVTVAKHIRVPDSFFCALEDLELDKLSLFANDGEKDRHYLVAESFVCADKEVRTMQQNQQAGTLAQYFQEQINKRENSTLKNLAQNDTKSIELFMARNPAFLESNVAYLVYRSEKGNRVLFIYNTRRLVDFVEKRQLNPNASGSEGLLHSPASLAFHVDPLSKKPCMTRLQDAVSN